MGVMCPLRPQPHRQAFHFSGISKGWMVKNAKLQRQERVTLSRAQTVPPQAPLNGNVSVSTPIILMLLRVLLPDPCTAPAQPMVTKQRATPAGLSDSDRPEVEVWRPGVLSPGRMLSVAANPFCPLPLPHPQGFLSSS